MGTGPRESRLEGRTPGFLGRRVGARSPVGAGRKIEAASGSLPFPGVGSADIMCPPVALSAPRVPAAVTRTQVIPWLLSLHMLLSQFMGNLFSDLTSRAPALPLSDSLKSDPLQGHCDKKEGRSNLTREQEPALPMPQLGQGPGFSN